MYHVTNQPIATRVRNHTNMITIRGGYNAGPHELW